MRAAPRPLAGLTVAEGADGLATRYAGFLLAELGAEVTALGEVGDAPGDRVLARRKRFVAPGRAGDGWQRLAASADVVLTDLPDAAVPDGRVVCHVSAWGGAGPRRDDRFDEALLAAVAGVQSFQWSWSGDPVWLVTPMISYTTGILAALGTTAAYFATQRGAPPQRLDVSALDAALTLNCGRFVSAPGSRGSLSEQGDPYGAYPTYGVYRTADGWIFVGALTPAFFVKLLTCLDRVALLADPAVPEHPLALADPAARRWLRDELAPVFRSRRTAAWLDTLRAADVPCGAVRTRRECLEDAEARAAGHVIGVDDAVLGPTWQPGAPADFWLGPNAGAAAPAAPAPRACLEGVGIVDLTSFIAGPFCPRLLADLGADVVKVETAAGDPFRMAQYGFIGWNRGKRSIVLDLKTADDMETFRALVARSDVLVDNFRTGVMDRLGLSDAALANVRADLVRVSITGYGPRGPDAARPGFDPVFQARTGLMQSQGGSDDPVVSTIAYNDYCAGALAALSTVAALSARARDGAGRRVHVSLFRTALVAQAHDMVLGDGVAPGAAGGRDFAGPAAGCRLYACADGWVCVAARRTEDAAALGRLVGVPLATGDAPDGPVAAAIAAWLGARARDRALAALRDAGVPAAPCLRLPERVDDALVRAAGAMAPVLDDEIGADLMPGPSIHFERTPIVYTRGAPRLDADGAAIRREIWRA
jgi:crotonobetainyl-CoA:carnitine CoA-transferase CaiB-like acyl-CoA transferase